MFRRRKSMARIARMRRGVLSAERLDSRLLLSVNHTAQTLAIPRSPDGSMEFVASAVQHPIAFGPTSLATTTTGSGDNRIESLRSGYKWGSSSLTYSFFNGGSYYGNESSPSPVSDAVKANVRYIFENIFAPAINMTFTEVADTASSYGVMRFLASASAAYAYARYPTAGDTNVGTFIDVVGDVVLNPSNDVIGGDFNSRNNSFQSGPGSHGFLSIVHEIGHALGLKHPHEAESSPGSSVILPTGEDNYENTVMTYQFLNGSVGASATTLMSYDVLSLQYFYGANTSTRANDTTYTFTAVDEFSPGSGSLGAPKPPFGRMKQTLWDAGGIDTIDMSALPVATSGYRIDIQSGGWITTNASYNSITYRGSFKTTDFGTRIPLAGTTIENVIVTRSSDTIYLNDAANVVAGYSKAAGGADVIYASNQSDRLDLRPYFRAEVTEKQVGDDLIVDLGVGGTVTLKNYYGVPSDSRIQLVFADPPPAATISDVVVTEGNVGETIATFTIALAAAASQEVSLAVATQNGTATTQDNDYFALPTGTRVVFATGQTTQTVQVRVRGDRKFEPNETFSLVLSSPQGVTIGDGIGEATILNDDPDIPFVSVADTRIQEGNSGPSVVRATITLSKPAASPVTVFYRTLDDTATTANSDYTAVPNDTQLVFAAGETRRTIEIQIIGDKVFESDERFRIDVQDAVGAVADGAGAWVTLANDDRDPATLPNIRLLPAAVVESTGTRAIAEFILAISGRFATPFWLSYSTVNGTAQAGSDYSATSGRVKVLPGQRELKILVPVLGDRNLEFDEFFSLSIAAVDRTEIVIDNPLSSQLGIPLTQTRAYVLDDDTRFFTVQSNATSVPEGTPASFTVDLRRTAGFGEVLPPTEWFAGLTSEALAMVRSKIRFEVFFAAANSTRNDVGNRGAVPPSRDFMTGKAQFGYLTGLDGTEQPVLSRQFDVRTTPATALTRPSSPRSLLFQLYGGLQAGKPSAVATTRIAPGSEVLAGLRVANTMRGR